MKQWLFPLLLAASFISAATGQTARQYLKQADEDFANLNYYSSMKHYQMAMEIDGEETDILYKYAESARLFQSFTFADTAYTKVVNSKESEQYPLAKYWWGTVKKKLGQYEAAQKLFRQFVDEHPGTYPNYTTEATTEVQELEWAIEAIKSPDENVTVERLGNSINTAYSEFAPVIMNEDLYYSSLSDTREFKKGEAPRQYAIEMKAEKAQGEKIDRVAINDAVRHTAHAAFNHEKTRIYYCLCDYVGETADVRCEIWYRPVTGTDAYGAPVKLPDPVNKDGYTNTDVSVAFDETTGRDWLLFASDRPGSIGKLDLWGAVAQEDGSFEKPVNLTMLNTVENDVTPFYHSGSRTLYFSTDGRKSFGGYDIYKALYKNSNFTNIEHLPVPYNSSYNDTHYWMNDTRTKGYFSSSRLGSLVLEPEFEACCNDLYNFTVQVVDLNVYTFNKKNDQPLEGVTVELVELSKDGELRLANITNPTGNDFKFELKKNVKYALLATRQGFLPVREEIDMNLPINKDQRQLEKKLYLVPEQVDLNVTSFNKKNMNPLKSVEVRLVVDGQEIDFKKNDESNNVNFVLDRGKQYQLIGSKVAYFSDTAYIDLRTDVTTMQIDQKLLLKPKEIEDFPPLVIYFDNDQPNPRTRLKVTDKSYKETWESYMVRKELFRDEYVTSLVGFDSITASRRMEAFFDREVNNGYLSLEVFTENILEIMNDGGFKVELVIQGFTSPRASADYNSDLSERRSDCLKNHFETWRGGILKPFVDKEMLTMEVVGYGEKLSPQFISDRLDDERGSIYSVVASFERKVAIIGARRVAEN